MTTEEIANSINKCLSGHIEKPTAGSIILALTYIAGYISIEELVCRYGLSETLAKTTTKRIQKSGDLNEFPLPKQDSLTRKLFYLSPTGFEKAKAFFDEPGEEEFRRRKRGLAPIHDYSAGMSVLPFLNLNMPFEIYKEVGLALSKTGRTLAGTLRIDKIINFSDTDPMSIVFIEQDMGTEPVSTLVDKLINYDSKNMIWDPEDSCIIFSFRDPNIRIDTTKRSKEVDELLKYMGEDGADIPNLTDVMYGGYKEDLCMQIYREMGNIRIERYRQESPGIDMYIEDVEEYKKSLNLPYSSHKYAQICIKNDQMCKRRYKGMARMMCSAQKGYINALLDGYSIYTLPTTQIDAFFPYILPTRVERGVQELEDFMKSVAWDPKVHLVKNLSDPILDKYGLHVNLKNIFIGNGDYLALEYVSRDLGALIRCKFFRENILQENRHMTLVMMVDDYDDARFIAEMLNYYEISSSDKCAMVFTLKTQPRPFLINRQGEPEFYKLA